MSDEKKTFTRRTGGEVLMFECWHGSDTFGYALRLGSGSRGPGSGVPTHIASPIEFVPYDSSQMALPCLQLETDEAQELMQALWRAGLRPEGHEELTTGEREAYQAHLKSLENKTDRLEQAQGEHIEDLRLERDRDAEAPRESRSNHCPLEDVPEGCGAFVPGAMTQHKYDDGSEIHVHGASDSLAVLAWKGKELPDG